MAKIPKSLLLGVNDSEPGEYFDEVKDWDENVNIKDFEIVVADLSPMNEANDRYSRPGVLGDESLEFPATKDVIDHCIAGGDMYVILPNTQSILFRFKNMNSERVNVFDWIPGGIEVKEESGDTIAEESVHRNWNWYFSDHLKWPIHFGPMNLGDPNPPFGEQNFHGIGGEDPIAYVRSLARNRVGESVAIEIRYSEDLLASPDESELSDGGVFLLPGKEMSYGELFESILQHLYPQIDLGKGVESIPDWVDKYTLPEEKLVLEEINELRKRLDNLQNEREGLEKYKELLYEKSGALEETVHESLREMGLKVEGEIDHGRDGAVIFDDHIIILEIYGSTSGIPKDKARQLDEWVSDHLIDEPERNVTGLLVANPFCEENPVARDISPEDVIDYFKARGGHKFISSLNLYKMVKEYQNGNLSTEEVENILTEDGIKIEFDEVPLKE